MAKQIISLGYTSNGLTINVSMLFWFPITSGQKPQPGGSAWTGASAAENTAIQNGSVLEVQQGFSFPTGTPFANIKAQVLQAWTLLNTQIGGLGPNSSFGVFYDSGTGWSA